MIIFFSLQVGVLSRSAGVGISQAYDACVSPELLRAGRNASNYLFCVSELIAGDSASAGV